MLFCDVKSAHWVARGWTEKYMNKQDVTADVNWRESLRMCGLDGRGFNLLFIIYLLHINTLGVGNVFPAIKRSQNFSLANFSEQCLPFCRCSTSGRL